MLFFMVEDSFYRSPIPGSGVSLMTSGAMTKLYAKLAAIEREENVRDQEDEPTVSESRAIVKERAGAMRILTKSVSVSAQCDPWLCKLDCSVLGCTNGTL